MSRTPGELHAVLDRYLAVSGRFEFGCLVLDCMMPYVLGVYNLTAQSSTHAQNAAPSQRVEITMMRTARDIRWAYDQCFEPLELNLSQASLIGYIAANGPTNQTQLAAALVLGRAATGSVVDQLEKRALVQRVPDPDDRRVWLVENTPAGAEVAVEIISVDEQLRKSLRAGITRAERQQLADLLVRLSANAADAVHYSKSKTNQQAQSNA